MINLPSRSLDRHFSYIGLMNFHKLTRTRCSLLDRWMQLWPEPPDHVNHLRVEPPFGLLGAEVKHLRQGERLKADILGSQDVLLRLEPKEVEA
jgi:hypothetical protein